MRSEIHPRGAEVVTVALDTGGPDAVAPFVSAANPEHPSLIDEAHITDELFGFTNVPMAVWIDESGVLVRPAHTAQIQRSPLRDGEVPDGLPERLRDTLIEVKKIPDHGAGYRDGILDWVEHGPESSFAMTPAEVVERSQPRSRDAAEAAACFELGQHAWRAGDRDGAVPWFRRAHALDPSNWTYKRQAWTFATTPEGQVSDLLQGPTDLYEGNWLDDIKALGAENYYPKAP